MRLPFTPAEFFDVFVRYNDAVWPAQLVLVVLAAITIVIALRGGPAGGRRVNAILAVLWLWMAVAYHLAFFAAINRAAILFAIAFAAQAALFAWLAFGRRTLVYRPRANASGIAGAAIMAYALVGYPIAGYVLGHRYPASPTFGVPCPTTIFTIGMLLWATGAVPRRVVVVPALWTLVATSAAVTLRVTEDFGLLVAALVAGPFILGARGRGRDVDAPRITAITGR